MPLTLAETPTFGPSTPIDSVPAQVGPNYTMWHGENSTLCRVFDDVALVVWGDADQGGLDARAVRWVDSLVPELGAEIHYTPSNATANSRHPLLHVKMLTDGIAVAVFNGADGNFEGWPNPIYPDPIRGVILQVDQATLAVTVMQELLDPIIRDTDMQAGFNDCNACTSPNRVTLIYNGDTGYFHCGIVWDGSAVQVGWNFLGTGSAARKWWGPVYEAAVMIDTGSQLITFGAEGDPTYGDTMLAKRHDYPPGTAAPTNSAVVLGPPSPIIPWGFGDSYGALVGTKVHLNLPIGYGQVEAEYNFNRIFAVDIETWVVTGPIVAPDKAYDTYWDYERDYSGVAVLDETHSVMPIMNREGECTISVFDGTALTRRIVPDSMPAGYAALHWSAAHLAEGRVAVVYNGDKSDGGYDDYDQTYVTLLNYAGSPALVAGPLGTRRRFTRGRKRGI